MDVITTHVNTDLDALAAMVAAHKIYPGAEMVLPGKLSQNVEEFMSLHKDTIIVRTPKEIDFGRVKRLILVDTKNPRRIAKMAELVGRPGLEVHIYDHHPWSDGDLRGTVEVVEAVGAATTLLVELIKEKGIRLTPLEATLLALGIYEDTGSLIFSSTTPRDLSAVAFLLEQGANLAVVGDFLGRPLSNEQKDLLKALILNTERHQIKGVKVVIARANSEEFIVGLALLTHMLAEIERPDATFVVVRMDDRVHMVGRSSVPQVNVQEIMSAFKGSGHAAAASATIKNSKVDEVVARLVEVLYERVRPPLVVRDIMSSPVKTVFPETTIQEAWRVMLRYGHTGLPVVQDQHLVGVISRRDVEKALHHGLGHAPVKGFMSYNVIYVYPDQPVAEVQDLMIEHDIGRVPVVENGRLVGIVSRTDILRTLHGEVQHRYRPLYSARVHNLPHFRGNIADLMQRNLSREFYEIVCRVGTVAERLGYNVYAAGGIVRDILLGVPNFDLDLVVEGDGIALAEALAREYNIRLRAHRKFGTAELLFPGFKVDVATARVEFYEYPAALPEVESSSIKHDLYRRDFTINAMAVALNEGRFGELVDFFGGRNDLHYGLVRVLYNLSFIEDPTRILRAVRFEQRYGMRIEPQTLKLLKEAVRQDMLTRVSYERIWEEVKHILMETNAGRMLARFNDLGIWPYIFPDVTFWEVEAVLRSLGSAMEKLKEWGWPEPSEKWLCYLVAVLHWSPADIARNICRRYRLSRRQEEKILTTLSLWRELVLRLGHRENREPISEQAGALLLIPREAHPLLFTVLEEDWMRERFRQLVAALYQNRPQVNGKFIKGLGVPPGPIYRQVLDAVWRAKMDGLVTTLKEEEEFVIKYLQTTTPEEQKVKR